MALLLNSVVLIVFLQQVLLAETRAPKINPFHFSGELDVGMRASVHCAVIYGDIPFEFTWLKNGHQIQEIRGISFRKTDEYTSNLVISEVNADSNGNYTCRVTNSKGSDEKSAFLSVKGINFPINKVLRNQRFVLFTSSGDLSLGKRVTVGCSVIDGKIHLLGIAWMKGSHKSYLLETSTPGHTEEDFLSNLIISKLDSESNGKLYV
ncbi:titin [Caerostris extrusa]|uniref:Titin n=1 Tax=Caerostris extrusa TaxID=172846 RepID=A0AAV4NKH8_CAEEX|nr:titin [Caerostris extrusa]